MQRREEWSKRHERALLLYGDQDVIRRYNRGTGWQRKDTRASVKDDLLIVEIPQEVWAIEISREEGCVVDGIAGRAASARNAGVGCGCHLLAHFLSHAATGA